MSRTEGIDTAPVLAAGVRQHIAEQIDNAGQNEVFFLGRIDEQGQVTEVMVVAAPKDEIEVTCGGAPLLELGADAPAGELYTTSISLL